jgi:hypothetical protein
MGKSFDKTATWLEIEIERLGMRRANQSFVRAFVEARAGSGHVKQA